MTGQRRNDKKRSGWRSVGSGKVLEPGFKLITQQHYMIPSIIKTGKIPEMAHSTDENP